MRRTIIDPAALLAAALLLTGCGFADSRSPVPEFMRAKEAEPPRPEPPPDVRQLVRDKLESVFVNTSNPREVRVSGARREVHGQGWTACVRAELTSAMGKPLGVETYRILISGGDIIDRRRAEAEDTCGSESYQPI
jgi:hypothetical protein